MSRRALLTIVASLAAFVVAALMPAAAAAAVWREGVAGRPFGVAGAGDGIVVSTAADQAVSLEPIVSWALDASSPVYDGVDDLGVDPRCIQPLDGGRLLIVNRRLGTDDATAFIAVVRRDGTEEWSYRPSDDPQLAKPFCAQRFVRGGRTYTLIADRDAARVFAVDDDKRVVWQYGVAGEPGLGVDRLSDPYWATYTDDDTVLIADNLGAFRVVEVRWGDYAAGTADHGFTADSVVWQYGMPGVPGSAAGQLLKPRSPQRLPGDARHTLVTDADAHVVYEIDRHGRIVWRFGVVGEPGRPGQGRLQDPTYAERLEDGTTVIADTGNGLVVRVDLSGRVVASYDLAKLDPPSGASVTDAPEPRMATPAADGSLLVADSGYARFVEVGLPARATLTSQPLTMGRQGVRKRFLKIGWSGETPGGTAVGLEYRVDGGVWTALAGTTQSLPASAAGSSLQYRVTLASAARTTSPRLDSVAVRWRAVPEAAQEARDEPRRTGSGVAYMGGSSGASVTAVWGGGTWGDGSGATGTGTGGGTATDSGTGGAVAGAPPEEVTAAAGSETTTVTGSPVKLTAQGTGGSDGGGASEPVGSSGLWATLGAVVLVALAVPPIAGLRLQRRLDAGADVPATARRDARLLKGAR